MADSSTREPVACPQCGVYGSALKETGNPTYVCSTKTCSVAMYEFTGTGIVVLSYKPAS